MNQWMSSSYQFHSPLNHLFSLRKSGAKRFQCFVEFGSNHIVGLAFGVDFKKLQPKEPVVGKITLELLEDGVEVAKVRLAGVSKLANLSVQKIQCCVLRCEVAFVCMNLFAGFSLVRGKALPIRRPPKTEVTREPSTRG